MVTHLISTKISCADSCHSPEVLNSSPEYIYIPSRFLLIKKKNRNRETGSQIIVCNWNYFCYFSTKTYVVGTQKNRLNETILLSNQNTCLN